MNDGKAVVNSGIFDQFPGYRLPTEQEFETALESALVVPDANVLLNLYRYNELTRDDLLGVLRGVADRLWVPHQVMREFWRNRLGVLASRGAGTEQVLAALDKQQRAISDAIHQWAKTSAVETAVRDGLLERVLTTHAELEDTIQAHTPVPPKAVRGSGSEPVLHELEGLLAGKVGVALDDIEWQAAVKEGHTRVTRREPPGYLDADKVGSDIPEGAAGDYLVWYQAINEAKRRGQDMLLVTGDEKEDWWWRHRSELLGPRVELVAEFRVKCGRRLFMMRPIDLLTRAATLKVAVRRESVDDVERVSRESQVRPRWTAEGVAALLDRLTAEGWEHALVIRAAAARGGTIDRRAVYEICGYEDDRMLRGFTRPAARITSDLQSAGLVADGVEAALTPVYYGVKAAAFTIPAEMVEILSADETEGEGD